MAEFSREFSAKAFKQEVNIDGFVFHAEPPTANFFLRNSE